METSYVKLSIWLMILTALFQIHGYESCLAKERMALMELKAFYESISDIEFADDVLPSWVDDTVSDCCDWERVKCNAITRQVIGLNLTWARLHLPSLVKFDSSNSYPQLSLSLFIPFDELQTLNLSSNYFKGFYINNGSHSFGSLKQLEILDLGYNLLNDSIVPYLSSITSLKTLILRGNHMVDVFKSKQGLGNLRKLKTLDLSDNRVIGPLLSQGNLRNMKILDLSVNDINGPLPSQVFYNFGSLKQLEFLDLSRNLLNDSILPSLSSITSLKTLILQGNGMVEVFKSKQGLGNLRNLEILDLSENFINGPLPSQGLRNLTELKILDLSLNRINGSLQSEGFGNLRNLEILDLSENLINGIFPSQVLRNLTRLKILNLSGNRIYNSLQTQGLCELKNLVELYLSEIFVDGHFPHCLSNLNNLKVLDLSYNQLSGNLLPSILNFTSIEWLFLLENNFEGLFSFSSLANLSKLQVFTLSNSQLQIEDEEFFRLPKYQLKILILRNCSLHTIPNFLLHQSNLLFIDLSDNMLFGNFPPWLLQNNTKLQVLHLQNNSLKGILQLPKSQHGLLDLDVSKNHFVGQLPVKIGLILPLLQFLIISKNNFEGSLPSSMGEMKSLRFLEMSGNNFSGELPRELLSGCISLFNLCLSHNNFQGQVFLKYMNLTRLRYMYLDNNQFSEKIQDGLLKAISLVALEISNNIFFGEIPDWIGNFSSLKVLSMSNNLLEGNIPIQLSNLKYLRILDISQNRLLGSMTSSFNFSLLEHLYMHKNAFNGSIPMALRRSFSLVTLDLSDNQFSGSIPHWIDELSGLHILLLRGNHLQGYISNRLCQLKYLRILDLSYNKFNGSIPTCFINIPMWMQQFEYDNYWFSSTETTSQFQDSSFLNSFPSSITINEFLTTIDRQSSQKKVEFMTKNRYEPYEGNILNYMTGLDLSCNELTGDIPSELGSLQYIHALNLSHNYLSGSIPNSFSNLKMIESLDLCSNKLSGQIPPQLTELYSLAIFNVSYNNLSGPTPNTWQFANFDESNYAGNPYLCGPTIRKRCNNMVMPRMMPSSKAEGDESAIDMVAFNWSFTAFCLIFLLGLFVILWVNSYWRWLWFTFIDECIDSCFYWIFKYVYYICHRARA